jgi:RNA polymerase sigma factor (sigma-70 family)
MKRSFEDDLALARQCAAGDERAWERFVRDYRPILYRAADSLDPSGTARDIADSLYADLYGIADASGERRSLFRYFEGRSSLATWLRAVLAQRYVDEIRTRRRLEPLESDDDSVSQGGLTGAVRSASPVPDPDRSRFASLLRRALGRAVALLAPRDRLRLACYYVQDLTLAETGRVLGEHEATVSRQLAGTRRRLRDAVTRQLADEDGLSAGAIDECFRAAVEDPGPLDLTALVGGGDTARKKPAPDRSESEDHV